MDITEEQMPPSSRPPIGEKDVPPKDEPDTGSKPDSKDPKAPDREGEPIDPMPDMNPDGQQPNEVEVIKQSATG
jgi:hypothetical protein